MEAMSELYLRETGGSPEEYRQNYMNGIRKGQAFFNALSEADQAKIRATPRDMFYLDGAEAQRRIEEAIQWLLDH